MKLSKRFVDRSPDIISAGEVQIWKVRWPCSLLHHSQPLIIVEQHDVVQCAHSVHMHLAESAAQSCIAVGCSLQYIYEAEINKQLKLLFAKH